MSNHWIVMPVVLPAITATLLLLRARQTVAAQRRISVISTAAQLGVALYLLSQAMGGEIQPYLVGAWPPPFGIVLVLDRLSAFMVVLTAIVAMTSLLYAVQGWDRRGANYHALFQFQLMGLMGAFLTGDLFNLFVFFEVLLISSYGLLLHGGSDDQIRAGMHYVIFNLVGSALFLVGVGLLYAATGTVNIADLAVKVAQVPAADVALVRAGGLILLVVFSVKAALLPLYFWLPATYASASAPVAALFAIMTKVGVYAIIRVFFIVFGAEGGAVSGIAEPWLLPLALLTLALGTLGAVAARQLRRLVAYLVIASVGTMLTAVTLGGVASMAAAIYYMAHSTFVLAAFFLLADLIGRERGDTHDRLKPAAEVAQPALLGGLFLVAGVAVTGLPPLSGFVGKVLILSSALETTSARWVFGVVLVTGLLAIVGVGRAGSTLFWKVSEGESVAGPVPSRAFAPAVILLLVAIAMAVFAGPVSDYATATARQLVDPHEYIEAVLESGADLPDAADHGPEARP
jgi:multicomponent K+:H+ antiporter subunit D